MKRLTLIAAACLLSVPAFAAPKDQTYTGEIMDSQCVKNGSHEMMIKKNMPDKASMANDPMVKAMCTKKCVQMGGKYVLYNAKTKKTYELDDQTKSEQFAGQNVKVAGKLDKSTNTIHVTDISAR